jgi:hypothetical protein
MEASKPLKGAPAILESFQEWRTGQEDPEAWPLEPSPDKILGFADFDQSTLDAELQQIIQLLDANSQLFPDNIFSWARSRESYSSLAEVHLEFIAMWALWKLHELYPSSKLPPNLPILVRILNSAQLSPFVVRKDNYYFLLITTAFLKTIDDFYRGFFAGVAHGRSLSKFLGTTCITSDFIGGRSVEISLRSSFKDAGLWLNQMMAPFAANDVFEIDLLAYEEVAKGILQVEWEFGRARSPLRAEPTAESTSLTYLTALFLVFHEISHTALGDFDPESLKDREGPLDEVNHEIVVDLLAEKAYVLYSHQAANTLDQRLALPGFAKYFLGPASYFTVFLVRLLAQQIFRVTTNSVDPNGPESNKLSDGIKAMAERRFAHRKVLSQRLGGANFSEVERISTFSLLDELCAPEVAMRMLESQLLRKRVTTFAYNFARCGVGFENNV